MYYYAISHAKASFRKFIDLYVDFKVCRLEKKKLFQDTKFSYNNNNNKKNPNWIYLKLH